MAGFGIDFDFGEAGAVCAAGGEAGLEFAAGGDSGGGECGAGLGPIESFSGGGNGAVFENEIAGIGAEEWRDGGGDGGFGVEGGIFDRGGEGGCGGGAAGEVGVGEAGVADFFVDVGHFEAEFFGDDGDHVGSGAGAEILGAAGDGDGSVAGDVDVDDALGTSAAAPDSAGAAHSALEGAGG